MNNKTKSKINTLLFEINSVYHDSIPLSEINTILIDNRAWLVQEDGTPWFGLLLGKSNTVHIDIANEKGVFDNTMLVLSWYKMNSGQYEITAYVS